MNKKRAIGLVLIILGLILLLMNPITSLTGFVVADNIKAISTSWFYALGLAMMIAGLLLNVLGDRRFVPGGGLEKKLVAPEMLAERITSIEPDQREISIVLDTSVILSYTPQGFNDFLMKYDEVFIPDSVIKEVKNSDMRAIIKSRGKQVKGFEHYRKIASHYLAKTEKPRIREFVLPYLDDPNLIRGQPKSVDVRINKDMARIREIMAQEDGIDLSMAQIAPQYSTDKVREYLHHCEVSEADVDVLSYALKDAFARKKAVITEKDIDFEQAIDIIKKEKPNIGKYLFFVNNYSKAA